MVILLSKMWKLQVTTIQRFVQTSQLGVRHVVQAVVQPPSLDDFQVENEPIKGYLPGSTERSQLDAAIASREGVCEEVPVIIGGKPYWTPDVRYQVVPFEHSRKIAKFCYATPELIQLSIEEAMKAKEEWGRIPLQEKINLFLKAADLVSGPYRAQLNVATMLGQGKTVIQAEIDAAAELADFFRFNAFYAKELVKQQPINPDKNVNNSLRHRSLDGFVAAISPFNFTAIGGNLAYAPALMGNVVLWKPSDTAVLSNYLTYKLMLEAGFPSSVVSFVPADGPVFGKAITESSDLGGINFTGSVPTFRWLWTEVGKNLGKYASFPRLVGECGGKNYHFIHPSADVESVVNNTVRAAFEYSGQKCSACSRLYVPASLWPQMKEKLIQSIQSIKVGPATDHEHFVSAVIDQKAYDRITSYIKYAETSADAQILAGGKYDNKVGYYVHPTLIESRNPRDKLFQEEIFGPVLAVYVYADKEIQSTLKMIGEVTPYALTGAIFAQDREFLKEAVETLKMTAGNFYINDKSTGAVVGQQPFGGSRLSGTNDKAGFAHYLLRWSSTQAVKENFTGLADWRYPYMKR